MSPSPAEEACPELCLDNAYDEGYQAGLAEAVPEEASPVEEPSPDYSGIQTLNVLPTCVMHLATAELMKGTESSACA